jgi:hypothetical protein
MAHNFFVGYVPDNIDRLKGLLKFLYDMTHKYCFNYVPDNIDRLKVFWTKRHYIFCVKKLGKC